MSLTGFPSNGTWHYLFVVCSVPSGFGTSRSFTLVNYCEDLFLIMCICESLWAFVPKYANISEDRELLSYFTD